MVDDFELQRFITAQDQIFDQVCFELDNGLKVTHWMWFIFPQLLGLGNSPMAVRYGVSGRDEAKAYLAHPVLGERLRLVVQKLMGVQDKSAVEILGKVDAKKLQSCLTLFSIAGTGGVDSQLFDQALVKYFSGQRDDRTVELLS